jgi:hypothetical protein
MLTYLSQRLFFLEISGGKPPVDRDNLYNYELHDIEEYADETIHHMD